MTTEEIEDCYQELKQLLNQKFLGKLYDPQFREEIEKYIAEFVEYRILRSFPMVDLKINAKTGVVEVEITTFRRRKLPGEMILQ